MEYTRVGITRPRSTRFSDAGSFASLNQHLNLPQGYNRAMNTPPVTDDMAEQEALARGYQLVLEGPLVWGEKSSHDTREEHTKADPVSVPKALQLFQAYSHYPPLVDNANYQWRRTYFQTNASRSLRQQHIIDSASAASNIQTNCAGIFDRVLDPSPMSSLDLFNLPGTVNIPGLSTESLNNHGFPSTYNPLSDHEPILTPIYPLDTSVSTPNIQYVPPILAVSPHDSGTPIVPAAALSVHSAPPPQDTRNLQRKPIEVPPCSLGYQFRHSNYEYESDWNDPPAQIFQTSMFKNSHYNTAHYSNPNFQPEEWSPDDEEPCTVEI